MDHFEVALLQAIAQLERAKPAPSQWHGSAARAAAKRLDEFIHDLHRIRLRLSSIVG